MLEMACEGALCERVFVRPPGHISASTSRGTLHAKSAGGSPQDPADRFPRPPRPPAPPFTVTGAEQSEAETAHQSSMAAFAPYGKSPRHTPVPTPVASPKPTPLHARDMAAAALVADGEPDGETSPPGPRPAAPASPPPTGELAARRLTAEAIALASAAPPMPPPPGAGVDFSGSWVLTRSEQLDEYLQAMGVNWVKRAAASKVTPRHEWERVNDDWQFTAQRPALGPKTEVLAIGARTRRPARACAARSRERTGRRLLFARASAGMARRRHAAGLSLAPRRALGVLFSNVCPPHNARPRLCQAATSWTTSTASR